MNRSDSPSVSAPTASGPAHDPGRPDDPSRPDDATPYTAPCRRCGRRVHLTEAELLASLTTAPTCWQCEGSRPPMSAG